MLPGACASSNGGGAWPGSWTTDQQRRTSEAAAGGARARSPGAPRRRGERSEAERTGAGSRWDELPIHELGAQKPALRVLRSGCGRRVRPPRRADEARLRTATGAWLRRAGDTRDGRRLVTRLRPSSGGGEGIAGARGRCARTRRRGHRDLQALPQLGGRRGRRFRRGGRARRRAVVGEAGGYAEGPSHLGAEAGVINEDLQAPRQGQQPRPSSAVGGLQGGVRLQGQRRHGNIELPAQTAALERGGEGPKPRLGFRSGGLIENYEQVLLKASDDT
mmetsp:Transcript_167093/g.536612  ORF Transcript_167093/g.536612 Transcript_167093/m.536612 type:complete len:276 (+) Transcript_167093:164-991(+)